MSIKELTIALGGKMQGFQGRAPCPNCQQPKHPNPSLSIAFGSQGQNVLIYCFKGCTFDDLRPHIEAVHSGEFEWDRNEYERHAKQQAERDEQKQNRAKEIMEAATTGSDIIESYLAGRGIDFDCDKDLAPTYGINYNCPSPDGGNHPALVFEVQDAEGWLRGVHRTFLEQDHSGQWIKKRDGTAKAMLGAMTGNHACLYRGETRLLIVTEGIEDGFAALDLANNEALFVQQYLDYIGMHSAYPWFIFNECSIWAALSAGGMANLELPPRGKLEFTDILIIADPDDAGRKAAQQLGERSSKMGYFAEIWHMQEKYGDLNNLLKFWKANDAFEKSRGAIG